MRIGLIGAGRIGAMHAQVLASLEGVDQVLIADIVAERAGAVAAEVQAVAVPSVEGLMDVVDAIVIAAATDAHAALVRGGIARRLPTYCEKPLGGTLAETIEMAELVEASGVPFQLGFQRRFDTAYREARRMVESGELGTVYVVRLAGHDPAPPHESYIPASGGLFRTSRSTTSTSSAGCWAPRSRRCTPTAAFGASRYSRSTTTWTPPWPPCT